MRVKSDTYTRLIKNYGGAWIAITLNLIMICFLVSSIYYNNVLLKWTAQTPEVQFSRFEWFSIFVFGTCIISGLFVFLRAIILVIGGYRASRILHKEMLHKVLCAPINLYYDVTPIG